MPDGKSVICCPAPCAKIFPLPRSSKSPSYPPPSRPTEGRLAIVTDAGRDAMDADGAEDEGAVTRTAKSCGPDAPMLASSLRTSASDGGKKAGRRGERGISRKTIARGMPDDFRRDLTNACACYHYLCTRGYRAHRTPGIPCALCFRGTRFMHNPGASRREIADACLL